MENGLNRSWGTFAMKCVAAVVYYAACTLAGLYLVHVQDAGVAKKVMASTVILLPLLVWLLAAAALRRRYDEYQRQLMDRSMAWAAQWAVLFVVLLNVAHLFVPLINAPDVFALPGLYVMASVLMGQVVRFCRIRP